MYVTITNQTRKPFSSEDNVYLSYHVLDVSRNPVQFDGIRTQSPSVKPFQKIEDVPIQIDNNLKAG